MARDARCPLCHRLVGSGHDAGLHDGRPFHVSCYLKQLNASITAEAPTDRSPA